jgi:hypothetical protein
MNLLSKINFIDPLLHVLLITAVACGFRLDIGIGGAMFLLVREAAQRDPHDIISGLDVRKYSLQKHLEIWPPAIVVSILYHLLF